MGGISITMGASRIPCNKVKEYEKAASYCVDALFSDQFESELIKFISSVKSDDKYYPAWDGLRAENIISDMRSSIDGTYAETYGGPVGLFKYLVFHNIAYDGTTDGPIRLNRWPLKKRSPADISNTIAHEVAHRIGLVHPSSDNDMATAKLEPPYVVGNIVGKLVQERIDAEM